MRCFFKIVSSLRLTVILLLFCMGLVFFGTLDQVHFGIHETQKRYFESFIVLWQYPAQWPLGSYLKYFHIPLLGGYALGGFLVLNLACAHFKYFVSSWKKIGITLIHGGLVVLIISGFLTSVLQEESQMWVDLGQKSRYSENTRNNELVIIDKTDSSKDTVTSIPASWLNQGRVLEVPGSSLKLEVVKFYPNADIGLSANNPTASKTLATAGAGAKMGITVFPKKKTYKDNEVNAATAYVRIFSGDNSLGTWLVSNIIDEKFPPQQFSYDGRDYEIALRFKRNYFPFFIHLLEFTHERYPGTDIPRNFSSLVKIHHPGSEQKDRQVLIYMNNPLRYGGYTFFQASYGKQDKASMLQVVRNPSRLLPYIAVLVMGVGLAFHFIIHLVAYLSKRPPHNKPSNP